MKMFQVGPVGAHARTKTEAREQAIAQAAKVLERLESCPEPLPGPPESEIYAIVFIPGVGCSWETKYVFSDRVLTHISDHEIGEVRQQAVEFAAQYNLSRHTISRSIERLTAWAERHLKLSATAAQAFSSDLQQIQLRAEAAYELRCVRIAGRKGPTGDKLSEAEVHEVLCGGPTLKGELLELYKHHVKGKGIK